MSKVSTRPRTAATPVAATVTAVTTPPSPLPAPEDWRPAAIAARDAISQLVFEAQKLDESERDDGCDFATRLMVLAVFEIGETTSDAPHHEFEAAAFNTKALINGALNFKVGHHTAAHLRHALVILDRLTDALGNGERVHPIYTAILCAPKPIKEPAAPGGLTTKQLEHVLETVATRTSTLRQMLSLLQASDSKDEQARSVLVDAASDLIVSIGAIADGAIGGQAYGDADHWNHGPSFTDEIGRAVQQECRDRSRMPSSA
eukprot:TRINITY_DN12779_c0_g2_i4.p1 TRINITY_DN12779_c0_g2~~TRINITY_DN12779_c0_g2_i4.p1  ORF type:complete len:260 (-),score=44.70 TRINITY_DN12779_c0_g2_i4:27-806(-)